MDKLLKLLIKDFRNERPSAEYQLVLQKVCAAEAAFIAKLNKKQKAEYLKLDFIAGELSIAELHEFADFLYKHLKDYLKLL